MSERSSHGMARWRRLGGRFREPLEDGDGQVADLGAGHGGGAELDEDGTELVAAIVLARQPLEMERGHDAQRRGDGDVQLAGEIGGLQAVGVVAEQLEDAAGVAEIRDHVALVGRAGDPGGFPGRGAGGVGRGGMGVPKRKVSARATAWAEQRFWDCAERVRSSVKRKFISEIALRPFPPNHSPRRFTSVLFASSHVSPVPSLRRQPPPPAGAVPQRRTGPHTLVA
jgi:hypothetical protein